MQTVKSQKSLVEQTYDILLDAICTGEIAPGERLNQDALAVRLNVSRQPINSALSMLRAQRLVEDTGRRGVVVAPVDPAHLQAILEVRQRMEPFAAELASQRRPSAAKTEAEALFERAERAIQSQNPRALLQADVDFHTMVYRWAGNEVLESTMQSNWHHVRRFMAVVLRGPTLPPLVWQEHRAIFKAIMAQDKTAAAALMADHLTKASQRLTRGL